MAETDHSRSTMGQLLLLNFILGCGPGIARVKKLGVCRSKCASQSRSKKIVSDIRSICFND